MNEISVGGRKMLSASRTGDGPLVCVTLSHASWSEPVRVVADVKDCVRDGNTFVAFPFRIKLPDEKKESLPQATLEIDNVDRSIGQAVLALPSPPDVTVEVVRIKDVLTIEHGPWTMSLISATVTRLVVQGTLGPPNILNEPYPGNTYSPALYPQLFDK